MDANAALLTFDTAQIGDWFMYTTPPWVLPQVSGQSPWLESEYSSICGVSGEAGVWTNSTPWSRVPFIHRRKWSNATKWASPGLFITVAKSRTVFFASNLVIPAHWWKKKRETRYIYRETVHPLKSRWIYRVSRSQNSRYWIEISRWKGIEISRWNNRKFLIATIEILEKWSSFLRPGIEISRTFSIIPSTLYRDYTITYREFSIVYRKSQ